MESVMVIVLSYKTNIFNNYNKNINPVGYHRYKLTFIDKTNEINDLHLN